MSFDWKKHTVQMLGRWQPWHEGHTQLFERAIEITGQVCIMVRDVGGIIGEDAGAGRTIKQDDNPFDFDKVSQDIAGKLFNRGYIIGEEF